MTLNIYRALSKNVVIILNFTYFTQDLKFCISYYKLSGNLYQIQRKEILFLYVFGRRLGTRSRFEGAGWEMVERGE